MLYYSGIFLYRPIHFGASKSHETPPNVSTMCQQSAWQCLHGQNADHPFDMTRAWIRLAPAFPPPGTHNTPLTGLAAE